MYYSVPTSLVAQIVKNLPAMWETQVQSQRREWLPTPGFLPGEFHGQWSLAGTVRGVAELDTAEQLTHKVIQRISGKGTF